MKFTPLRSSVVRASLCAASLLLALGLPGVHAISDPAGGALTGQRYRVIVSTDIGGDDFDDDQSMVHLLQYADVFDIEGLISSPPGAGRKADIEQVISAYSTDYSKLSSYSANYPAPATLLNVTKQGATAGAPSQGWSSTGTEGSNHIVTRALATDSRPLYVLVWGSLTDVAQAVHDNPQIKNKIRVICTAGSSGFNHNGDPAAWNYLYNSHADLWLINCNSSFRGMYVDSWNTGQYGNGPFISTHCSGHGALGNYLANLNYGSSGAYIKAGDTPVVLYLLRGDPNSPTTNHWGGRYMATSHGSQYWTDVTDAAWASGAYNGAKTVSQYHDNFMADWAARMNRSQTANPGNPPPSVSITSPASGASFTAGANITINATASDSNGTVTKVDFYRGTTLIATDTSSPYSVVWSSAPAGSYSLTAKATDNGGAVTTSSAVPITVNPASNPPPTVSITSPAQGASFAAGANITINATASDSNGTVTKVDFYRGTTLIGTDTSSPYSVVWSSAPSGNYALTAKATDNGGATTTSGAVNIIVTGGSSSTVSNLNVNDTSNASDWSIQLNPVSGNVQYGDRTYAFVSIPADLTGAAWIRTANDSKYYTGATLATFQVNADVDVYIGHNDIITTKPAWLGAWADTGLNVTNDETTPRTYSLFHKAFTAGSTVSLGNNGNTNESNYTIFVVERAPFIENLTVFDSSSAADWSVHTMPSAGDLQYGDRDYQLASVPAVVAGADWVRTANDSKYYTGTTLASFQVNVDVEVYVAHNDTITAKPSWLSTWTDTGANLVNDEIIPRTFSLYRKTFAAGSTVSLGNNGNVNESQYSIFVTGAE